MANIFYSSQHSYEMYPSKVTQKLNKRVKFTDDLILTDDVKNHDIDDIRFQLARASLKADLNSDTGRTLLHEAIEHEFYDIIKMLLEKKVDINQADEDGYTALHEACAIGNYDMAKFLLDHGADTNVLSKDGARPYDLIEFHNLPLVSLLLNHMTTENSNERKLRKGHDKSKAHRFTPTPSGSIREYFEKNLSFILKTYNSNINDLIEQINVICSNECLKKSKDFIYVLSTVLFESCIQDTKSLIPKINTEELSKKLEILKQFVDNNQELELECLYAVQNLDFKLKNPIGNLRHFFDSLYYCKVIRKEGFIHWRKEANPYRSLKEHTLSISLLKDFFSF